jgi:hypothetical protein
MEARSSRSAPHVRSRCRALPFARQHIVQMLELQIEVLPATLGF